MPPAALSRPRRGRRPAAVMLGMILVLVAAVSGIGTAAPASAQAEGSPEQMLVERHAPVVRLKAQTGPCDSDGEAFAPSAVDIVLDNPQVLARHVGTGDTVLAAAPGASDLGSLGGGFYLDFPGQALKPGCVYEEDFERFSEGEPSVVYARIAGQDDRPGQLVVQYWFWWYYNDWNNKHESDWEMIQLVFDADDVDGALATAPVETGYAQHEGGERAGWDSATLTRQGDHPVVYPSAGSHASYYGSSLYLGRSASEGFGCDSTEGPSDEIEPEVVLLPDRVDGTDPEFGWLAFTGRWGERHNGAFNGPTGPALKDQWSRPLDFQDDLRSSSVAIPGGGTIGTDVVNSFCGVVEAGSGVFINAQSSPLSVLVPLALIVLVLRFLIRSTVWTPATPRPLRRRRAMGQVLHGAARLYRAHPRPFMGLGLVYLPISLVTAGLVHLVDQIGAVDAVLDLAKRDGLVAVTYAAILGGLGNLIAFFIASAAVAGLLAQGEDIGPGATRAAYRAVAENGRHLASAALRATVVVVALTVSIVGIPWAILLVVRYQLVPQVVMFEGRGGADAVRRSVELTRGNWWETAVVFALLNAVTLTLGLVSALLVLIVLSFLPLGVFSLLAAALFALVVPYTAAAFALVYGDRFARLEEPAGDGPTGDVSPARDAARSGS